MREYTRFRGSMYSIYLYSYSICNIRNIGTNSAVSRLSAGFAGVPEVCFRREWQEQFGMPGTGKNVPVDICVLRNLPGTVTGTR